LSIRITTLDDFDDSVQRNDDSGRLGDVAEQLVVAQNTIGQGKLAIEAPDLL
jgi:hypothetical protein